MINSLKISINTDKQEFQAIGSFFEQIFSAKEIYNEPGVKAIKWSPHSFLEIHGPGAYATSFIFADNPIVISLEVEDLDKALQTAKTLCFSVMEDLRIQNDIFSFAYIKIRDGLIIGLYQNSK